jgi:sulfur-carrier protein
MRVTVKLFASLREGRFKTGDLELVDGTVVNQVVDDLEISAHHLGIVILNGKHSGLLHELQDGDTLWLMPIIAGG